MGYPSGRGAVSPEDPRLQVTDYLSDLALRGGHSAILSGSKPPLSLQNQSSSGGAPSANCDFCPFHVHLSWITLKVRNRCPGA